MPSVAALLATAHMRSAGSEVAQSLSGIVEIFPMEFSIISVLSNFFYVKNFPLYGTWLYRWPIMRISSLIKGDIGQQQSLNWQFHCKNSKSQLCGTCKENLLLFGPDNFSVIGTWWSSTKMFCKSCCWLYFVAVSTEFPYLEHHLVMPLPSQFHTKCKFCVQI